MRFPSMPGRIGPLTAAGLRRARQRRLEGLRALPSTAGWQVQGYLVDLSTRFPVPALLLADHAHAELALTGDVDGRSACAASVLARPSDVGRRGVRRVRDEVLLLTTVEVLGQRVDLVVGVDRDGELVLHRGTGDQVAQVRRALGRAGGGLRQDDCLAVGDTSLSVIGSWPEGDRLADVVSGRFRLLSRVADALDEGVL